jgi:predicted dinucleotide-binding enzyme
MRKRAGGNKVAILGAGKMGAILLQSFLRDGLLKSSETWATVAHADRARLLKDKLKIHTGTDNREAVRGADIVFLCVKPQVVADVVREIRDDVTREQLLISVAASRSHRHDRTRTRERGRRRARDAEHSLRTGRGHDCPLQGKVRAETTSRAGHEILCGGRAYGGGR